MDRSRRAFLRWTASAAALLLGSGRARAAEARSARDIHRATRNTRAGAVGGQLRAYRDPLPPFKPYPGRPRLALPTPTWQNGSDLFEVVREYAPTPRFADAPCSRDELARILWLANGVTQRRDGQVRRAAPSAGALYAGEVYVVALRVSDITPGVYYYAVDGHELVQLREGSFSAQVADAIGQPGGAANAAAAVLLTNVFERYAVRYANRGHRYAWIDSGHIGENVRLAAREIGLGDAAPPHFSDDRIHTLLEIDGREEAVAAVHLLGHAESGALEEIAAQSPAGVDSVQAAIRARRSAQHFASAPTGRADLLQILALARGNPALHRAAGLDLYAVVNRVADTPPGVYRYDAPSRRLERVRGGDLTGPLVRACLGQERSGQAGAALIGVARIAAASARTYRDLLIDAGATAQRIYLGAEALGLAARNLAAFYDDDLDALLGIDGHSAVAVHVTAVGPGD